METLVVFVLLFILVGPILSAVAMSNSRTARRDIEDLKRKIASLERAAQSDRPWSPVQDARPTTTTPTTPVRAPTRSAVKVAAPDHTDAQTVQPSRAAATQPPVATTATPVKATPRGSGGDSLEQALTSRWLVWLGGAAIALGGGFLVKYSIDQGWFGPEARVAISALIGGALVGLGEWLRRNPLARGVGRIDADQVAPSLTAAGIAMTFAAVWGAYSLYGFIGPLVAFVLLAAISFFAFGLALLHGPFLAALGLLGSYITPMLAPSDEPSAFGLFTYIFFVVVAATTTAHIRKWSWLNIGMITGAAGWTLLWFVGPWQASDVWTVGGFLLAVAAAIVGAAWLFSDREGDGAPASDQRYQGAVTAVMTVVVAVLALILLQADGYGPTSVGALAALSVFLFVVAVAGVTQFWTAVVSATLVGLSMLAWRFPSVERAPFGENDALLGLVPVAPSETLPFLWVSCAFAAFFAGAGFFARRLQPKQGVWPALSAAVPVLLLAIAYLKVQEFEVSLAWGMIGLALSAGFVVVTRHLTVRLRSDWDRDAIAAYATAAAAAIALAFAMSLERAFLTVSLAAIIPCIAWAYDRLEVAALRRVATVIAAIVLVRLAFNPEVFDYPIGTTPVFNWLLYGYGVPAACFAWSARIFNKQNGAAPVPLLQTGAIIFFALLFSLELHHLFTGSISSPDYSLTEASLQTMVWSIMAIGLNRMADDRPTSVIRLASVVLVLFAVSNFVLFQLIELNPLLEKEPVYGVFFFNILLIAYLAPVALSLGFGWIARKREMIGGARVANISALVLFLLYVTLETRRFFHGPDLSSDVIYDSEMYAYSVVWLVVALTFVGAAIRFGSATLRYASFIVLMATIAKVFLVDAAALTGVWRAASFIGLGLSLVGIGYVYQRYVFAAPNAPMPPANPEASATS
jgi:uncharacterized membrane protein